ncbi:hypothetical protein [Celerinatantimonas sp. MCCC 1A17872]|uniref:hypothetical protein n=1 Tax=Celerinatantimonas sp. MCCC 1A17872 TaxID=3177514 RepID=UPI0038C45BA1
MELKNLLTEFQSNPDLVKRYIALCAEIVPRCIEYRTCDEGMCNANLFVLPKKRVTDSFQAFVLLLNYQLHFYEQWPLTETTLDNAEQIYNLWLLPEVKAYSYKEISSKDIHIQIDGIIKGFQALLTDSKMAEKIQANQEQWGVFVNAHRADDSSSLADFGIDEIISGVGFELEWNAVELMYQTEYDYVYFSWATGA